MRFTIRTAAASVLAIGLWLAGTPVCGKAPPLPIPSYRPPRSTASPNTVVPKPPSLAPKTKGGKKKNWSPFGGKAKKRVGIRGLTK
jgi:hypothetical protein